MLNRTYCLLFALLAVSLASAQSAGASGSAGVSTPAENQAAIAATNAAVTGEQCGIDSTVVFLNDVGATSPQISVSGYIQSLTQAKAGLDAYENTPNLGGLLNYIVTSVRPVELHVLDEIQIGADSSNVTVAQRVALRADLLTQLGNYSGCAIAADKSFGNAKVQYYNATIAQLDTQISNLSAAGVDTSNLTGIINTGITESVDPLSGAVNGASTQAQVFAALNSYCLYDGCPAGFNYHLDQRFGIAKIGLIINALSGSAGVNQGELTQASGDLAQANAEMNSVGSAQDTQAQYNVIWDNVTAAATLAATAAG